MIMASHSWFPATIYICRFKTATTTRGVADLNRAEKSKHISKFASASFYQTTSVDTNKRESRTDRKRSSQKNKLMIAWEFAWMLDEDHASSTIKQSLAGILNLATENGITVASVVGDSATCMVHSVDLENVGKSPECPVTYAFAVSLVEK
ncbi:hypothetical protein BLNAU_14858 [Blattamonas nauphoetae]|uniref:Uncharacterized protein n=1 Tax=Blattamonas nauphoetae TaxID=2049346 RepID=A0ABQ9XHQ7_9EUKA|nr:hypothetical protein BLNAU_14858 [Blattamonas nauphoetae]